MLKSNGIFFGLKLATIFKDVAMKRIARPLCLFSLILLFFVMAVPAQDIEQLTLREEAALHREPALTAEVMARLKAGETVTVLQRNGVWVKVEARGENGYLYLDAASGERQKPQAVKAGREQKDRFYLMGLGMLRFNWAKVQGDEIRFRYSDLGLPADFSTRERAAFTFDGSFENGFTDLDGYLNYDPENRISEPPLDFLFNLRRGVFHLSVGDYRQGVMADAIFSRYLHPFRGAIVGIESPTFRLQALGGLARGESTVELISADLGIGPYYLSDSPVLRGSDVLFLVTRSRTDGQTELQRLMLMRNRDYHIDYDRGVVMLTFYLAPTDELGNPRFLEAAYQFESLAGRFTRVVFGARAEWQPWKPLTLSASYLGDADQALPLDRIWAEHKGILSFGLNLASRPLDVQSELAAGFDPGGETQTAYFVGAHLRPLANLHLMLNRWDLDASFPGFANRQLEYGYSLMQVNPGLTNRSVFLSPFQFTRNLGSELYPFSLSRLVIDERETQGILEWEKGVDRLSMGYGESDRGLTDQSSRNLYVSGLHAGEATVAWLKSGVLWNTLGSLDGEDRQLDLLGGFRQRLKRLAKGDLFLQVDLSADWLDEAGVSDQTRSQVFSLAGEYLSGQNGVFAGVRREQVQRPGNQADLSLWSMEMGVKHPLFAGFFVDSRYRHEQAEEETLHRKLDFLSLGLGFEQSRFRAMARYEVQTNHLDEGETRRRVWSLYMFGSPLNGMSLSLQYLHQFGDDNQSLQLTRQGEEQLNFRFVWRMSRLLNVYSQWRYDSNLELLPPLDEIRSHSLAAVQGVKLTLGKRLEALANYKLLKVWGPIENRKYAAAAELGYLMFRHLRLGIGVEQIDYRDVNAPDAEYQSTVGYLKLVVMY